MLRTVCCGVAVGWMVVLAAAQDTQYPARGQQFPAPACMSLHNAWEGDQAICPAFAHERWLADLRHWRNERRIRIAYDPSRYEAPAFRWTQSSFIQPQMMVQDRYFYDPIAGRYTVDRYLDDVSRRYGGIDAVLIWSTYPNMGMDDRNQLEMVESMPGGIEGVRQMVADFHRRGVRVLFPMMMWDEGTREPGKPWPEAIAELMKKIDADGVNGDTQDGVPLGFSLAADKIGHPLAFEPEGGPSEQYPWEDSPRRFHEHAMQINPFYIDKFPVTNAQFKQFLDATHYVPHDTLNFLRDWRNGTYPQGWENHPVTWVSLEDAWAYAQWLGKRLPHEWEWQIAAQGTDGRTYPWGDLWNAAAVPLADTGRSMRGPDPADAHPLGASPYGVMDMVGNVWQWTDEFVDEHTRAAIVRGGEYYQPQGSMWYFPQAYRNDEHSKVLLMAPSYDRSGGIGFRCVRDAN